MRTVPKAHDGFEDENDNEGEGTAGLHFANARSAGAGYWL